MEQKQFCSNCKKHIGEANFTVHSLHCQRNIQICEGCQEPVPRKEMSEHLKTAHATVSCEKCSKQVVRWKLEQHQDVCDKRLIPCIYCDKECHADKIKDHESYCGARTELCPKCGQYVMIKDQGYHERNCTTISADENDAIDTTIATDRTTVVDKTATVKDTPRVRCPNCEVLVNSSETKIHQNLCGTSVWDTYIKSPKCPVPDRGQIASNREITKYDAVVPNTEIIKSEPVVSSKEVTKCYRITPGREMVIRDDISDITDDIKKLSVAEEEYFSASEEISDTTTEGSSHCSVCTKEISSRVCGDNADTCISCIQESSLKDAKDMDIQKNLNIPASKEICGKHTEISDNYNMSKSSKKKKKKGKKKNEASRINVEIQDSVVVPCPRCKMTLKISDIDDHVAVTCKGNFTICDLCSMTVHNSERDAHMYKCIKKVQVEQYFAGGNCEVLPRDQRRMQNRWKQIEDMMEAVNNEKNAANFNAKAGLQPLDGAVRGHTPKREPVMLPCEFCDNLFSEDELPVHQSGCRPDLLHGPQGAPKESSRAVTSANLADKPDLLLPEAVHKDSTQSKPIKIENMINYDKERRKMYSYEDADRNSTNTVPGEFLSSAEVGRTPTLLQEKTITHYDTPPKTSTDKIQAYRKRGNETEFVGMELFSGTQSRPKVKQSERGYDFEAAAIPISNPENKFVVPRFNEYPTHVYGRGRAAQYDAYREMQRNRGSYNRGCRANIASNDTNRDFQIHVMVDQGLNENQRTRNVFYKTDETKNLFCEGQSPEATKSVSKQFLPNAGKVVNYVNCNKDDETDYANNKISYSEMVASAATPAAQDFYTPQSSQWNQGVRPKKTASRYLGKEQSPGSNNSARMNESASATPENIMKSPQELVQSSPPWKY